MRKVQRTKSWRTKWQSISLDCECSGESGARLLIQILHESTDSHLVQRCRACTAAFMSHAAIFAIVDSPCSRGGGFMPVAFNLRASFADISQQEPLFVSWSLSAWSLSPWPLSRRLARSGSLNVELLHKQTNKQTHMVLVHSVRLRLWRFLLLVFKLKDFEGDWNTDEHECLIKEHNRKKFYNNMT